MIDTGSDVNATIEGGGEKHAELTSGIPAPSRRTESQPRNRPQRKAVLKPKAISGFPEYSPAVQWVADLLVARIRKTFELHGFVPIETPAVERLEVLQAKGGDVDKEMYVLQRLHAVEGADKPKYGLHYDLTVPFARYVAAHFNELVFPFKRYQIQPCWRGERPQEGRYRQFVQCDIDVVCVESLPLVFDCEVPLIMYEALRALEIGPIEFRISNRKILQGYLAGLGITSIQAVTRILDKLDKIGSDQVLAALIDDGIPSDTARQALRLAEISASDSTFRDQVHSLGVTSSLMEKGLDELEEVIDFLNRVIPGAVKADLSVTRGFDYYTGTVYEVTWPEFPEIGSIAAGGRYDDLASCYTKTKLPGVGMSLGFSRIFGKLVSTGRLPKVPPCPTTVLVTWLDASGPQKAHRLARKLRSRGINTEVYHRPGKLVRQLKYADKKGIPYVVFDTDEEVKDMRTGEQMPFDVDTWLPENKRAVDV